VRTAAVIPKRLV